LRKAESASLEYILGKQEGRLELIEDIRAMFMDAELVMQKIQSKKEVTDETTE
jgi:hypothetical protein